MKKDITGNIREYIIEHSKIIFPIIVCAAVAVTVVVALRARNTASGVNPDMTSVEAADKAIGEVLQDIPMVENADPAIDALILAWYNAAANGDMETLTSLCDGMQDKDYFRYQEYAKYIEYYPVLEIYTKPGPKEGTTIAYVYYRTVFINHEEEFAGYKSHYICTDEETGELYIKYGEISEEEDAYMRQVSSQVDMIEFNNRITVEYNELLIQNPALFEYVNELEAQVNTAVGEQLAKQNAEVSPEGGNEGEAQPEPEAGAGQGESGEQQENQEPAVQYVTATTTVNVRSSDSENADRLGQVSGGTRLELVEQRVNGWSKVIYEGREAYIKSEFLELVESAAGAESIGTVTAVTNINVRASASETADRLGILAGGESVDLIANENGWCKIKYNGRIGYVKADYVE